MIEEDVQLIYDILEGDDEAFGILVEKYQKSIHALVWRKIGDFHYAEEITQDTFLRAYEKLSTLRNPTLFAGWLYVIANRLCLNWMRKHKSAVQSLEGTSVKELNKLAYERYVSDQRETEATERRFAIVERLLKKLPESERTVVTLYYLGEMTTREIGRFLGVSANTIQSRLHRARQRLQGEEEILISETLGSIQVPANLTQNIMRQVPDMKPTAASTTKPLLPWVAFGAAAVMLLFILGVSNRHLTRFQRPYSFEATSEPTIEIVDVPIILNIDEKQDVRNQPGRATTSKSTGAGAEVSERVSASNASKNSRIFSSAQWTQSTGPQGGPAFGIFAASNGTLYTSSPTGIYKLKPNTPAWTFIDSGIPTRELRVPKRIPMAEHQDILYILSNDNIFTSIDNGETWDPLCTRPHGYAIGLFLTGEAPYTTIYLALQNNGFFHSTDAGKQWKPLNNGLTDRTLSVVAGIQDTLFAGTDNGLYRLNSGVWERLLVDVPGSIYSLEFSEGSLYVATGPNFLEFQQIWSKPMDIRQMMNDDSPSMNRIFRSTDLGASWADITPADESHSLKVPTGISLLVAGQSIFAQALSRFRSTDAGQTWSNLGYDMHAFTLSPYPSVVVSENTFYRAAYTGVYRTIDAGKSWHLFMNGMIGTDILDLFAYNNRLYAHTPNQDLVQSTDGGNSWETVQIDFSPAPENFRDDGFYGDSKLAIADNILYAISEEGDEPWIYRLSPDGNVLTRIQDVPALDVQQASGRGDRVRAGAFAVGGKTFYAEYQQRLFKWKLGTPEWIDTGLVDPVEQSDADLKNGFKLAVSVETVYVGKRDGKLFQSLDSGTSWRDVTPNLPRPFTRFNEIVFVGSTVFVATDTGVLSSETGAYWRSLTDKVIINRFAVDGRTVYGAGDTGVYRSDTRGKWEQISPSVPGKVRSLVVDGDRLYIATQHQGIFHISLKEKDYNLSHK